MVLTAFLVLAILVHLHLSHYDEQQYRCQNYHLQSNSASTRSRFGSLTGKTTSREVKSPNARSPHNNINSHIDDYIAS